MAKVRLENDTLNPPKCPSNWEYSTGQRQLLDIQSGEQMDRLSFSAQTKKRLEKARDVFVFCCFTGFDYSTTASLTEQNLVLADDGSMWIETHRVKTGVASKVKFLDIPLSILKKYESTRINGYLLPVLSNAKYNLCLKEIATALGIQKRVTSHSSRHALATTVTLTNGVPIESVSKMLGHRSFKTTQIYAKIVNDKLAEDMTNLSTILQHLAM